MPHPEPLTSEMLFRYFIQSSPDLVCSKDGEGRWLEANASTLRLLRLEGVDYRGKTNAQLADLADSIFRDVFLSCQASDEAAWRKGMLSRSEESIPLAEGGMRHFDLCKLPLFNPDGSRQGLVVLGRDITELKEAESVLLRRSNILDALTLADQLLFSKKPRRETLPSVLELVGRAATFDRVSLLENEPAGQDGCKAVMQSQWHAPGRHLLSTDFFTGLEYTDACHSRWGELLMKGAPIFGSASVFPPRERAFLERQGIATFALIPVFLDKQWWGALAFERHEQDSQVLPEEISALMSVSRSLGMALQREKWVARLHQAMIAFESASEGIVITDADQHITAINHGFTAITGYTEEEALGNTPSMLSSGRHGKEFYAEMWQTIGREGRWSGEIWNRCKDGEIYPEWLTITVVKDDQGHTTNYVAVFSDISEQKASQERLHALVNHDPLTGLPNRRLLNELMEHAIRRAERGHGNIAVLFIDLDRFKAVNDTLGHQVGDRLLTEVTQRLKGAVRESDVVARLGGDEFMVMMDGLEQAEHAATVAKKIIETLQKEFTINGKAIFVGASIGISLYPNDGATPEDLVKAADIAMYQVKSSGKNNYRFFSPDMGENALERFTLDAELRRALERRQFEVFYQPQVSLETGRILGAEALLRWQHPEKGLVPPAKFIPLAEETGIITSIGEWVLREAATLGQHCIQTGYSLQWVAVNVSGVQIHRGNFADTVYSILVETGCPPEMLELEITESALMENIGHVVEVFNRLKEMGTRLAIDDFGTGYSSLSYLKRLPLDKLKIDQSFVRDLPNDDDDAAITDAILALGRSLGLSVIAEGVETAKQETFLRQKGCHEAQGYLYGRPMRIAELLDLLKRQQA